jgi:hypothetical protein
VPVVLDEAKDRGLVGLVLPVVLPSFVSRQVCCALFTWGTQILYLMLGHSIGGITVRQCARSSFMAGLGRRRFLQLSAAGAASAAISQMMGQSIARAAEIPRTGLLARSKMSSMS